MSPDLTGKKDTASKSNETISQIQTVGSSTKNLARLFNDKDKNKKLRKYFQWKKSTEQWQLEAVSDPQ